MRLLLVGALSWNPERMRSLHERGHRLWSIWSRSMAWDQGPYRCLDDCVTPVPFADAARTIRAERIDAVYSLFQVYHPRLWGRPVPGVDHDVWTILRMLLAERRRGAFDAPIVRHWGFDVHSLAPDVVRALDGHVFCNREKLRYWAAPRHEGGCGLGGLFAEGATMAFQDGDRPKLEFMNDAFSPRLSERDGEIHTVCIGRPFGIDYLAAARRGIHIHFYGNRHDDVWRTIARDLAPSRARRDAALIARHLHLHPSLQPTGGTWDDVRRAKSAWVREFSRYDAGWSYVGRPLPWEPLDDRAAIPSKVATYLAAGLPVIADERPGWYRYDEIARLRVDIGLTDYDALRARLEREVASRERHANAVRERSGYSFDASIDPLLATIEAARSRYFALPHRERARDGTPRRLIHLGASPDLRRRARRLVAALLTPDDARSEGPDGGLPALAREAWRALVVPYRARRLARTLPLAIEPAAGADAPDARDVP